MSQSPSRVLIVDDEESICWGLAKLCEQMGLDCQTASSAEAGLDLARQGNFQAIVMDVRLPGLDGIQAISKFHEILGNVPVITITAFGDLQTAIESVQAGAFDYVVKPFELATIQEKIRKALAVWQVTYHAQNDTRSPSISDADSSRRLVGSSPLIQEVYKQIAFTTTTDSPVLITGESGTGKELTARAIHAFSARSKGPFVAVNIAALNPTLAESELFGHIKGAFTGADVDRMGLIQQASGGTLFLDEVAEIPIEIQVKLLRVLDQGEVIPVGSNTPVKTDFRLLSATHQNLLGQVNHGDFRHDLFYRLRTFEIQLPPLREHREDIPDLARHFLRMQDSELLVSDAFVEALQRRSWPGNVRELRSVVERAAILARGGVLAPEHIESSQEVTQVNSNESRFASGEEESSLEHKLQTLSRSWMQANWETESRPLYESFLNVVEPAILSVAFELCDEQYSAAARRLGIHRTTLKKKLTGDLGKQEGESSSEGSGAS